MPPLAAMGDQSMSPYLLYKMIGFDALHVRFCAAVTDANRRDERAIATTRPLRRGFCLSIHVLALFVALMV